MIPGVTGLMVAVVEGVDPTFASVFPSNMEITLCLTSMGLGFTHLLYLSNTYLITVTTGRLYADHSRKKMISIVKSMENMNAPSVLSHEIPFSVIQRQIEKYFEFVRNVNENLSVIPFALFAVTFVNFISGIAYVSLNAEVKIGFTIISFMSAILNPIIVILQIMSETTEAKIIMENVIVSAMKLSCNPLSRMVSFEILEARRSLTVFLQQQSVVPFAALSLFSLGPSVYLSFCNAIVPFTVMIITTIAQIVRDRAEKTSVTAITVSPVYLSNQTN